jgi:hypothetical protein
MYLLFYSKYCKYSQKFLELVEKIHYGSHFEIIPADKQNGKRHPFISKYNIKEIPTIIVNQRVYVGKEAFKWLQSKIKSSNTSLPVESVRQNKIPQISGYVPDISSMALESSDSNFDGNSTYCSLDVNYHIETPKETENVEKTQFILPSDSITGSLKSEDVKKSDRSDAMKKQYELMEQERKKQDSMYTRQVPNY